MFCGKEYLPLKMKNKIIYLLVLMLSVSLALAVDVTTNKNDYSANEVVSISITDCIVKSIYKILNADGQLIDVDQGISSWDAVYNTKSSGIYGKYSLSVSCSNLKERTETEFCVNSPGCLGVQDEPEPEQQSQGGSGTGSCLSRWVEVSRTTCNASLMTTVTQKDIKCNKGTREIIESCDECKESWVCSIWTDCTRGVNKRNCVDEHFCSTTFRKPSLLKNCNQAAAAGYPPTRVSNEVPPPASVQQPDTGNVWIYIMYGVLILILLVVIIVLLVHFAKGKSVVANVSELIDWITKERKMGASDAQIRKTLQSTAWTKEEITDAFNSFK